MLFSYNWLKDYLGESLPEPADLAELLTFHSFEIDGLEKVGEDTVIDIKILPDRGSDCMSHRGIAREIATVANLSLLNDPLQEVLQLPITEKIAIVIEDKEDCQRFAAALISNIKVGPSPEWLQTRLTALGQRSINNIVDATNYVMYALGQPLHAYDADLFTSQRGQWHFLVRRSRAEEVISILPEKPNTPNREITLTGTELLIVDGSSDLPIGLAGIKGGSYASVNADTKNIIIEAASFNPSLIRRTARALGIVVDGSKRFENEPSRVLPPYALKMITELIKDIAGGELEGLADVYLLPRVDVPVLVRQSKVNQLLGLDLSAEVIESILKRLGAKSEVVAGGWLVTTPPERTDLVIEANYLDEIGRIYGLTQVKAIPPETAPLNDFNKNHYYSEVARQILLDLGFSEIITSSFRNKDEVRLQNSLASDKSYLRSSLTDSIKSALALNIQNVEVLGLSDVRLFEIGITFRKIPNDLTQHLTLAFGRQAKKSGYTPNDDKIVEAAGAALMQAGIPVSKQVSSGVWEFDLGAAIISLPEITKYQPVPESSHNKYQPFSVYPAMARDIAMWVSEGTNFSDITAVLTANAGPLLLRTTLFDEFSKEGKTSFAFRLVFQAKDRTLTDEEVQLSMDEVYKKVAEKGWEVR